MVEYNGVTVQPAEKRALEDLEDLVGEPIPAVHEVGWYIFGFKTAEDRVVELGLDGKRLSSLPESLGSLSSLEYLSLIFNQLRALPKSLGSLFSLQKLWVHENQLSSLPESFGSLSSLQELSLRDNQLSSLPASIWRLRLLGADISGIYARFLQRLTKTAPANAAEEIALLLAGVPTDSPEAASDQVARAVWGCVEEDPRLVGEVRRWLEALPEEERRAPGTRAFEARIVHENAENVLQNVKRHANESTNKQMSQKTTPASPLRPRARPGPPTPLAPGPGSPPLRALHGCGGSGAGLAQRDDLGSLGRRPIQGAAPPHSGTCLRNPASTRTNKPSFFGTPPSRPPRRLRHRGGDVVVGGPLGPPL